jgi:hypothetical protein
LYIAEDRRHACYGFLFLLTKPQALEFGIANTCLGDYLLPRGQFRHKRNERFRLILRKGLPMR